MFASTNQKRGEDLQVCHLFIEIQKKKQKTKKPEAHNQPIKEERGRGCGGMRGVGGDRFVELEKPQFSAGGCWGCPCGLCITDFIPGGGKREIITIFTLPSMAN